VFAKNNRKNSRQKNGRKPKTFLDVQTKREAGKPIGENASLAFVLIIGLAVFALVMFFGIKSVANAAYSSNERYRLVAGHIQFQTSPGGLVTPLRAMQIAGIDPAGNLFDFDIKNAREKLLALPAIEKASLRRNLPDGLEIRIRERDGIARLPGRMPLLVDAEGLVIRLCLTPADRKHPMLSGTRSPNARTGLNIKSSNAGDGLEVVNIVRSSPFLPKFLKVSEVDVSDTENLIVHIQDGMRILMPRSRLENYLNRAAQFLDQGKRDRRLARHKINTMDFTSGELFVSHE